MDTLANKIFNNRLWQNAENIVLTILFAIMIKGLCDYDTALYQTQKYVQADIFVLSFSIIIFVIRKVRLINVQSLLATVAFVPIAIWQIGIWNESPDIQAILKVEVWAEWFVLMILIDMLLYKKISFPNKDNVSLLILYVLTCTAMLFHRNGRNDPLYLVCPLCLFLFTRIDKKDWERIFKCLVTGVFLFFVFAVIKSFITVPFNPRQHVRYYGYFTNIGAFGMFLGCVFVCALIAVLYSKEHYGRKNVFYIGSCIWMLVCMFMVWLTNTITLFAGIGTSLAAVFFFARKKTDKKTIIQRVIAVVIVFLAAGFACFVIYRIYGQYTEWYIYRKARNAGIWSPFYSFAQRIVRVVNNTDRSSLKRFIFTLLDSFSSNRLSIIKAYSEYFNFNGNAPMYLEVDGYFALSAHNNYAQVIVDYGYVSALIYFVLVGTSFIAALKRYLVRGKTAIDLFPVLWIAMCLGIWLGEACGFVYPATFVMLILICRMISEKDDDEEETSNINTEDSK